MPPHVTFVCNKPAYYPSCRHCRSGSRRPVIADMEHAVGLREEEVVSHRTVRANRHRFDAGPVRKEIRYAQAWAD